MKTIIYFITHHSINWPLIWSDCSPFIVLWLFCIMFFVIWYSRNYCNAIEDEYLVRTTVKMSDLIVKIDELTAKNKDLQSQVRGRDEKGHFLPISGKGHKKRAWTKATSEELLKEANRRYKVGNIILCAYLGDKIELINKEFNFSENNLLYAKGKTEHVFLYFNGNWAKKV